LFLISWGADINKVDKEVNTTPLHLAAESGSVKLVKKLLICGAEKTVYDLYGKTPLDIAKENEFR